MALTFAWTPPGCRLGSIALAERPERLTANIYWLAMADRIDRMVAQEDPNDSARLLRVVERNEPFLNLREKVGGAMAFESEWLRGRVYFPAQGLPARSLIHQPAALAFLVSGEDTLEAFLNELYPEEL